ncbi:N-acetyltransferase B complex non catalytic subunit-domain-containing protein [Melampsora americana]|nr:N-acetyltransferase B complex non catalytic subunit-domain-containing protein [Melampsora americana]
MSKPSSIPRFLSALNSRILEAQPDQYENQSQVQNVIRPIYELIQQNQLKASVDQINRSIKKHPKCYLLYAIKAFVLHSLNRHDQAIAIFNTFNQNQVNSHSSSNIPVPHPANFDPTYVQFISYTLLGLGFHDELVQLYEKATQSFGVSVDAYLTLAQINRPKDQQQIALKLHKTFPNEPRFIEWILIPLIVQLTNPISPASNKSPNSSILSSLAHRFIQTYLSTLQSASPRIDDPSQIWIIIKLLSIIGNDLTSKPIGLKPLVLPSTLAADTYLKPNLRDIPDHIRFVREDFLKILDSEVGSSLRSNHLGIELFWRNEVVNWTDDAGLCELISRMKECLSKGDTNWDTMITINKAIAELCRRSADLPKDELIKLEEFYKTFTRQENIDRGFVLARVDLRKRIEDQRPNSSRVFAETSTETIVEYANRLGSKACCFDDLRIYIDSSSDPNILVQLRQTIDTKPAEEKLLREINFEKTRQSIKPNNTDSDETAVKKLLSQYHQYLKDEKDLPEKSVQAADEFIILSILILLENRDLEAIHLSVYLLEIVLENSRHRYQARTLIIRLYRLLGSRSMNHYGSLGLKHIQLDTCGYLAFDRISILNHDRQKAQGLLESTSTFYIRSRDETRRWIQESYIEANYSKIHEFDQFAHKLDHSIQLMINEIEYLRLRLCSFTTATSNPTTTTVTMIEDIRKKLNEVSRRWKNAVDNRDLCVLGGIDHEKINRQTSLGPPLSIGWVRVMSSIYGMVLIPNYQKDNVEGKELEDLMQDVSDAEKRLYEFGMIMSALISSSNSGGSAQKGTSSDELMKKLSMIFKESVETIIEEEEKKTKLPGEWLERVKVLHEAYCLFQFTTKENPKLLKSLRNTRNEIIESFKKLETWMKLYFTDDRINERKLNNQKQAEKMFKEYGDISISTFGDCKRWEEFMEGIGMEWESVMGEILKSIKGIVEDS